MKTSMRLLSVAGLAVLAIVLFATCSDPTEDEVTPKEEEEEEEEVTPDEADALLETLSFSSGTKITGSVPSVVNTSLVKSDSEDTIYTMPGVKMLLRLSHPLALPVKGWYVAAEGSTFYYDVPIDDEEDSDSVSVVIFEIDAEDDESPYDIQMEITPYDNNNQPIDKIKRRITVEEPITVEKPSANGCDILSAGDTLFNGGFQWNWIWEYTTVSDPNNHVTFINAPAMLFKSTQHPTSCCEDEGDCPTLVFTDSTHWKWVYNSQVTAETSYSIRHELFSFFNDGTFARFTLEDIVNFNPQSTDWCNRVPGYTINTSGVLYFGTHNYVPGNSSISYSTLRKKCDDRLGLCGFASRPGSIKYSCHSLMITVDRLMLDFTKEIRVYRRRDVIPDPYFVLWKD